ncbi:MAG: hypothetical protein JJP05_03865 [cyanobacterium endosymbiont of Rhopalodia gibba]
MITIRTRPRSCHLHISSDYLPNSLGTQGPSLYHMRASTRQIVIGTM